jgi:hypothetical protein
MHGGGLQQKGDGIVQQVHHVLAAHPATASPELVSINMLAAMDHTLPPVWRLLVYYLILNC